MEIANRVLPVSGIGGALSNPLGNLLVALAGYTPHILCALAGFAGVALGIAVFDIAETRRLWHRNKVSRFQATVAR